jgi:hypothetical protein
MKIIPTGRLIDFLIFNGFMHIDIGFYDIISGLFGPTILPVVP